VSLLALDYVFAYLAHYAALQEQARDHLDLEGEVLDVQFLISVLVAAVLAYLMLKQVVQ
jgi:hypothetical protein